MHSPALDNQAKQVFGNISNFHNNSLCHPSGYASSTGSFNPPMGQQIIMQNTWRFTVLHLWYELNWFIETSPKHDSIWASGNMGLLEIWSGWPGFQILYFLHFLNKQEHNHTTLCPPYCKWNSYRRNILRKHTRIQWKQKQTNKHTYKNTIWA